jgi:pimeloyl-ACP methyl ester carboxylesterase
VERLVLLDAIGSLTNPADQTAKRLRHSCLSVRKEGRQRSKLRPYPTIAAAVAARRRDSSLSEQAARLLCERSLEHTGNHYQWSTDPRLNWRSPVLLTDDQVLDLLAAIRAPVLAITSAKVIDYLGEDMMQRRLAAICDCEHVAVDGHHHFHMDQAEAIEASISGFLQAEGQAHDND